MAETSNVFLQPTLQSSFHSLDPFSLILSQRNSDSDHPLPLRLVSLNHVMERGPRYEAYAELRESKLRIKFISQQQQQHDEPEPDPKPVTPPTKLVRFQSSSERERQSESRLNNGARRGRSALAQSLPNFSAAALRKENRKPANTTPPPAKSLSKASSLRGSKSANAAEKRGGGVLIARKSYAAVDELRSLTSEVGNAINDESKGGGRKTVVGYRKF